jgi:predicted transcriptional regulator
VKRALAVSATLALTLIVIGCFAAQLYQQQTFQCTFNTPDRHIEISSLTGMRAITINQYILLGAAPAFAFESPQSSQTFLTNSTRNQIYSYINQNPGVQFRAICAGLCLPVGLAEYHLGVLVRAGLVSFVRDGRYKRFFVSKRFCKRDMALICLLRHRTARRVLEALLGKRRVSHCKLAGEVAVSSQALTWQMKTLRSSRFVLQTNEGIRTVYYLDEAYLPTLQKCLVVVQ